MINLTASSCVSAATCDMAEQFSCADSELQPCPIRLPMRLYMRFGKVAPDEALNCNCAPDPGAGGDIASALKSTMNRWRADGLNLATGRVDYEQLERSKVVEEYRPLAAALRSFDPGWLVSDDERKAFWINIYNVLLIHGVLAYRESRSLLKIRGAFERIAYVIGRRYSLDDIEHGVLRGNRAHFLIPGVRFSRRDPRRKHTLAQLDPRIHFALVCGASSCPPIGIYRAEHLDHQLDLAATNFINNGGVDLNRDENTIALSRIFQWYSPDFGGNWMGLGSRTPVLRYIAKVLGDEEREYVLAHADRLRVGYQHYDWALNV